MRQTQNGMNQSGQMVAWCSVVIGLLDDISKPGLIALTLGQRHGSHRNRCGVAGRGCSDGAYALELRR